MEKRYEELYKISMEDIKYLYPKSFMQDKLFKNIQNLGELLEFFDNPDVAKIYIDKNSDTLVSILGSIKLLKYHYLNIDPKFNRNNTLQEMGFSNHTFITMNSFFCKTYKINIRTLNAIEVLQRFSQYDVLSKFRTYNGVGRTMLEELDQKTRLILQYFEVKENEIQTQSDDDLKSLYIELRELLQRSQALNEQIIIVQNKIQERTGMIEEMVKRI